MATSPTPNIETLSAAERADQQKYRLEEARMAAAERESNRGRLTSILELVMKQTEEQDRDRFVKDIVGAELERDLYERDGKLARVFALSGEFSEIKGKSEEQAIMLAMTKIQIGRSWGLSAADSMKHVFFNNGKPGVENELVAAKLREKGWTWDIEWLPAKQGSKLNSGGCVLWPKYQGKPLVDRNGAPVSISFTESDADAAMIYEKGGQIKLSQKWNYLSWAKDMFFWRCIGRLKKQYATDVLTGARTSVDFEDAPPADAPLVKGDQDAADEVIVRKIQSLQPEKDNDSDTAAVTSDEPETSDAAEPPLETVTSGGTPRKQRSIFK